MSGPPENPFQPPEWSSDLFRDPAMVQGGMRMDRGLIGHVPIVAILLITQGVLELVFAVFGFGFLAIAYWVPAKELSELRGVGILLAMVSAPSVVSGLLRIVAGVFNLQYRRRGLGIAALSFGLVTMLTGYCAPTAIALAIYGLVVYVNEPVVMAFRMGDGGRPLSEIRGAYLTQ